MTEHEHDWVYHSNDQRQEWSEEYYRCADCDKQLTRHFAHTPNIVGGMDKRIEEQWIES